MIDKCSTYCVACLFWPAQTFMGPWDEPIISNRKAKTLPSLDIMLKKLGKHLEKSESLFELQLKQDMAEQCSDVSSLLN